MATVCPCQVPHGSLLAQSPVCNSATRERKVEVWKERSVVARTRTRGRILQGPPANDANVRRGPTGLDFGGIFDRGTEDVLKCNKAF
jgi:hypothetical protein